MNYQSNQSNNNFPRINNLVGAGAGGFSRQEQIFLQTAIQTAYENQSSAADEIIQHFNNDVSVVLLHAEPGVGKTGTLLNVVYKRCLESQILPKNVLITCGLSDNEWTTQMKRNIFIPSISERVYHRGALNKIIDSIGNMTNGIIVIDECHVASGKNMTIGKVLNGTGLTSIEVLRDRNIKILQVSATPESVAEDLKFWEDQAARVVLEKGECYRGFREMKKENRILEIPDLSTYHKLRNFMLSLEERYMEYPPKFFIFRLLEKSELREFIIRFLTNRTNTWNKKPVKYDMNNKQEDMDSLMSSPPEKHTVILVKGYWSASKRLVADHIGATYEAPPKQERNTTMSSQGLTARFCNNYPSFEEGQIQPLHYGDVEAIEEYIAFADNDFNGDYTAPRLKIEKGKTIRKQESAFHPSRFGIEVPEEEDPSDPTEVPIVIQLTEAEYSTIARNGKEWDYSTIVPIIKKYKRDIIPELERIESLGGKDQIVQPTLKGSTYKIYITDFVNASSNNKRHHHVGNIKNKTKDTFQIYLDKVENRIIVNIYYGSRVH